MAKYKFYVSVCHYDVIEVEADSYAEAHDKAWELDGERRNNEIEVLDVEEYR